jgi:hypothetical protein
VPVTNVRSHWSGGDLIFHEALSARPLALYNIFTIGDDAVTVGSATNDIDFKVFLGAADQYALFDWQAATITLAKVDVALSGDLAVTVEDISLADDSDLEFGDGTDVLMRWSTTDASNHALVLALSDTSQQMHITDKGAVATDWIRSAGTHPELAIHSNTTPVSDYLAIGNHDGTTAHIDVVGGTTLSLDIAGTAEVTLTATALSPATSGGNALGTATLMWANLFLAEAGVINFNNGNVLLTHAAGQLTITGKLLASNAAGPAVLDEAATTTNPTLCPDKAEEDTGIGWASDTIHIVLGGASEYSFSTTTLDINSNTITNAGTITATNAAGPTIVNLAATTTVPTLCPNRAEADTGIGWASDVLHVVLGGVDEYSFSGTALDMNSNNLEEVGTVGVGGLITSTSTTGFRSTATFVPDANRTNYAFAVGWRGAANELTVDLANAANQNFDPIQMNINLTASSGAPSSSTVNLIYQNIVHDTVDMPELRLKGCDWTIDVRKNTRDAYVVQTELDITGDITFSGEASAGAFQLNAGSGAVSVSSRLNALMAVVVGSATVTGNYYVADFGGFTNAALDAIINLQTDGSTSATSGILMDIDGTVTYAIDFQGTVSDGWTSGAGADLVHTSSEYALIPVRVAGVTPTLYILAAETWA